MPEIDNVTQNAVTATPSSVPAPTKVRDNNGRFVPKADAAAPEPSPTPAPEAVVADQPQTTPIEIDETTRRALIGNGTCKDDDDIRQYVESLGPERAERVLSKARESRIALAQRFAALGQTQAALQQQVPQQQQVQPGQFTNGSIAPGVTHGGGYIPTLEKFREVLPEEAVQIVYQPMKAMADRLAELEGIRPMASQTHDWVRRQQAAEATRELNGFIASTGAAGSEMYGGSYGSQANPGQQQNLRQLVEMTDRILLGAQAKGEPMTPREALEMAHDVVSAPYAHEQARRDLQSKVQQRQSQMLPRPTSGGPPPGPSGRQKALDALAEVEKRHGIEGHFTGKR